MPASGGLGLIAQGLSVVTAVVIVAGLAAALFFAYRAVRLLLEKQVRRGSVGVRVLGFVRVDLNFGETDASAVESGAAVEPVTASSDAEDTQSAE